MLCLGMPGSQYYRCGAEKVGGEHGLSALRQLQLLVKSQFHHHMAGIVKLVFYITHLSHLEAVKVDRCRNGKTFHISVLHIIVIGSLKNIYAFKKINTDKKNCKSHNDEGTYREFLF